MSPPRSLAGRLGRATATLLRPRSAKSGAPQGALTRALGRATRSLLGSFGGALRHIGLRLAAVFYLVFAVGFGSEGIRTWRHAHVPHHAISLSEAPAVAQLELALALVFVYFGISSITRASRPK